MVMRGTTVTHKYSNWGSFFHQFCRTMVARRFFRTIMAKRCSTFADTCSMYSRITHEGSFDRYRQTVSLSSETSYVAVVVADDDVRFECVYMFYSCSCSFLFSHHHKKMTQKIGQVHVHSP